MQAGLHGWERRPEGCHKLAEQHLVYDLPRSCWVGLGEGEGRAGGQQEGCGDKAHVTQLLLQVIRHTHEPPDTGTDQSHAAAGASPTCSK